LFIVGCVARFIAFVDFPKGSVSSTRKRRWEFAVASLLVVALYVCVETDRWLESGGQVRSWVPNVNVSGRDFRPVCFGCEGHGADVVVCTSKRCIPCT